MEFLFEPLTFVSAGSVEVKMSLFEVTAMTMVIVQIWLYGRLSLWGPIFGAAGAIMWIIMAYSTEPKLWGLIFLNVIILYLQGYNYWKWSRSRTVAAAAEEVN